VGGSGIESRFQPILFTNMREEEGRETIHVKINMENA
jgi:hypothetical protein